MADTEFKIASLANLVPFAPTMGQLAPNTPSRWAPFRQLMGAQDASVAGTRRVVGAWTLSGSAAFSQPVAEDGAGPGQALPDIDTYRTVGTFYVRQTPGAMLEAHVLYAKCGLTQRFIGSTWSPAGPFGQVRVRASWVGDASSGTTDFTATLDSSADLDSDLPSGQAGAWTILSEDIVSNIRPAGFSGSNATAQNYSEPVDATLQLQVRGGVRPVCLIVYELPIAHVQDHDDAGPFSVAAVGNVLAAQTARPQIEAADGATYEEHRFGTYRVLDVAAEQEGTLVPRLAHWVAWDEGTQDPLDTDAAPVTTSSTTPVHLLDSGITDWSVDYPGWSIAAAHALPHRYSDAGLVLRDENAVVPVRIQVDAEWTTGGGSRGTVRFQTGPYEWIDVVFSSTGVRETRAAYGLLNSQVYADHHGGLMIPFIFVEHASDVLEVFGWSLDLLE